MKHRLVQILAFICYWIGIDALFYRLNKKSKRIITFHNVLPERLIVNKNIGIIDSAEDFRRVIRIIKSRYRISNDISDVETVSLTFDDGYKNQVEIAGRILKEEGDIPAIVFIAGKMIGNDDSQNALVVDLLLHWVWLVPVGCYKIGKEHINIIDINRSQIWESIIWPTFCRDSKTKGYHLLSLLDGQYPISKILGKCEDEYLRLRMTGISTSEINQLREMGWVVGWHTQEHFPLSFLSKDDKRKEIADAPEDMKSEVFSYPYGELRSVDETSIALATEVGYPCAVSNLELCNAIHGKYFLPRMMLSPNFYECHFVLSGAKFFFQTRKLLPIISN